MEYSKPKDIEVVIFTLHQELVSDHYGLLANTQAIQVSSSLGICTRSLAYL